MAVMRRACLCALLVVGATAGLARANGRFPATTNVQFQPGNDQFMLIPATYGLQISSDGGQTIKWVCEAAVGYTGTYDPDYEITSDGVIYATTFEGLRRSTDHGCSWVTLEDPDVDGTTFINSVEIGPDGRIWAATSQGGQPNDIFVSEDGVEFESTGLLTDSWWLSVETTPADVNRVYASGYYPGVSDNPNTPEDEGIPPRALLRRRTTPDGPWEELLVDDFNFVPETEECQGDPTLPQCRVNPFIYLLGVSPTDPDLLFARAVAVNPPSGDDLYRSTDGGESWEKVLDLGDSISGFVIRQDGTVVVGSARPCLGEPPAAEKGCVRTSSQNGAAESWQTPATEIRMQCLGERSDGVLFACVPHAQPDLRVLVKSTDGESWETVMRFSDLAEPGAGPLECADDTVQATTCVPQAWPQLACIDLLLDLPMCAGSDAGASAGDAGVDESPGEGGCCRVGSRPGLAALPTVLALLWLVRPRRRRSRRAA